MRLKEIIDTYSVHDARELSTLLPRKSECIDVTITSPPYWNVKDYGYKQQIGFGQSYDRYLDDLERVFEEIYEATKPSGSLWIVADTFKQAGELKLLPFDIAERARKAGWLLQDIIIWQKDRTLPWSHQGKLRNIFEYVSFYTKTKRFKYNIASIRDIADLKDYWVRYPERYSPEGKTPSRTWAIAIPRQGAWGKAANYVRHACPLPVELVERILRLTTSAGDIVFDPFAGSGSVLATANAMGRHYIGTDLNKQYREMFYDTVLPSVLKNHTPRLGGDSRKEVAKSRFAAAVRDLRSLKLPKELIRLYRSRYGAIGVDAVIALPSSDRRELTVVVRFAEGQTVPEDFEKSVMTLLSKRPLSKYGIRVNAIAIAANSDLRSAFAGSTVKPNSRLYVYANGRFFCWAKRTSVQSYLERPADILQAVDADRYPPIVSPINLRISPDNPEQFFVTGHDDHTKTKETA